MKKKKDLEFYNSLDEKIRKLISFSQFQYIEKLNYLECDFYEKIINTISEISGLKNASLVEKIINVVQVLDLEYEKFGRVIKNCKFIKDIKKDLYARIES